MSQPHLYPISDESNLALLICNEIGPKNGHYLHRKLTRLRLPRYLKTQLFGLLETGHFQVAQGGSMQRAIQQALVMRCLHYFADT